MGKEQNKNDQNENQPLEETSIETSQDNLENSSDEDRL